MEVACKNSTAKAEQQFHETLNFYGPR